MIIATHTNDRKALVKAIAEELGVPSTYLRAPTYAYSVGDFTVLAIESTGNRLKDGILSLSAMKCRDFEPISVFFSEINKILNNEIVIGISH